MLQQFDWKMKIDFLKNQIKFERWHAYSTIDRMEESVCQSLKWKQSNFLLLFYGISLDFEGCFTEESSTLQ
jgi:hypothetical protein